MTRSVSRPTTGVRVMYGYPWGMPPPQIVYPPNQQYPQGPVMPTQNDLEKGFKLAVRMRMKEERKKEKAEEAKNKAKADDKKKAEESKGKTLMTLEWYILGIISYPIVGPLFRIATHNLEVFGK